MPDGNCKVPILPEDGSSQKGGQKCATMGTHHMVAHPTPSPRRHMVRWPWPTTGSPLCVLHPPETLRTGESPRKFLHIDGTENHRERKHSGREKSAREIPSYRVEIIAIVTVIELGFIEIIIISTTVTITSEAPLRHAITSRVESCVVHRRNSPGVNYSLLLMLLSEIIEFRFMPRLLFIIISPLIMIPMMSCE